MRVINAIVISGLIAGLTACGAKNNKKENNDNQEQISAPVTDEEKQQLESEFSQIPAAAIVRVPVDANGETVGDPEMKTVSNGEGLDNADGMAAAFENGAAPQKMVSGKEELDGDSSTQSWHQWDNYDQQQNNNCYGASYYPGCGNSYQRTCSVSSGCGSSWGHSYWYNNYKPVLYSRGYGWNYGIYRPTHYVTKGYRYYCYRPYSYWK